MKLLISASVILPEDFCCETLIAKPYAQKNIAAKPNTGMLHRMAPSKLLRNYSLHFDGTRQPGRPRFPDLEHTNSFHSEVPHLLIYMSAGFDLLFTLCFVRRSHTRPELPV